MSSLDSSPDHQVEIASQIIKRVGLHHPLLCTFSLYAMRTGKSYLYGVFASPWSFETLGVGKSVYALKTLTKVYGSWEEAKRWIVFMPQDFLRAFDAAKRSGAPAKMILWDDAGLWVGRMRWQDRYVKAVREFLNVIRTHCYNIVFTAPSITEIVAGIRDQINVFAFISTHTDHTDPPRSRAAIVLKPWVNLYLSRKTRAYVSEVFERYFEHYPEYYETRRRFVEIGAKRLEASLDEIVKEMKEVADYITDTYREIRVSEREDKGEEEFDEVDVKDFLEAYKWRVSP